MKFFIEKYEKFHHEPEWYSNLLKHTKRTNKFYIVRMTPKRFKLLGAAIGVIFAAFITSLWYILSLFL